MWAGLHRSGRRRRSCDDDARRRGLDATRRLPIRRCCCSPRGTPSARGASPRSCFARCRRLPTETWVGSVSRLLAKKRRRFDLVAPPRRPAPALRLPRVGACCYRRGDGLSRRMRARLGGLFGDALARETVWRCGGAALTNGTFARRCLLGGNKVSVYLDVISPHTSQPPHHSEGRKLSSRASDDDPRVGHPPPPSHAPPRAASQLVWTIRLGAHRRRRPPRQRR